MKLKLKRGRFDTTEGIQAKSPRVLDTLAEDFRKRSKNEEVGGTGVHMRGGELLQV
jgi:hypothetical protein